MTVSTTIHQDVTALEADSGSPPSLRPQTVRPIPTLRLYGILLLGLVIPLGLAWLPGWPLAGSMLLLVIYDLVVLVIAGVDYRRTCHWQFTVERRCESRLSIGRQNPVHLTLRVHQHPRGVRQGRLDLRDLYPPDFMVDHEQLAVDLRPRTETELTYHVFPPRRGAFNWWGIALRQRSPWRLMERSWRLPVETAVDVYPDLVGLRLLSVRLSLEAAGSLRRRRQTLGGTEFSELRDYNRGDDLRLLDWKATARRGRPLVRLLEPERDQPLIILLDRGRLMTAQVAGLKRFDWALNATLALSLAGLRRGDRVGVGVFDQEVYRWVGPQPGQSHLTRIMEQLYNLEPVMTESDYVAVVSRVLSQYTRRALVVLLTDIVDEIASAELLAAMGRLTPRFLPFCVAFRDPQVDAIAHQSLELMGIHPQDEVQRLYEQSVALDLLHQRQRAFAQVKQRGVMVLDAPANTISNRLVDQYLLLKARHRL